MRNWEDEFDLALEDLDPDSSVGLCPMRQYGSDIKTALKYVPTFKGSKFDAGRVSILKQFVYRRLNNPDEFDDIKVFIKQEPHKLSKIVEGRFRLISAVSLVDTMVDRILFGKFCRNLLDKVTETPCLIGWSPIAGGFRYLLNKFRGRKTRGLDKTAWDWTVREWLIKAVKDVLLSLLEGHSPGFKDLVDSRWEALFRDARYQFSDGTVVQQPGWGVMKSGCYLTIVINSIGQMLYHALAMKKLSLPPDALRFVTIGDDVTIEDFPQFQEYERIIVSYGAILKPSEPTVHIEFAGFISCIEFGEEKSWPEYWRKHLFQITHSQLEVSRFLPSYHILYGMEPNFGEYIRWLMARECPDLLFDRRRCKSIWLNTPIA